MSERTPPTVPFKGPSQAAEWLLAGAMLAFLIVISYFIDQGRAYVMGLSIGMIGLLVQFSFPLRREVWFWVTVACLVVLHTWAVFYFDWAWVDTTRGNFKLLCLFAMADLFAMLGLTYGIYRLKYGVPAETMLPSIDDLPRYNDRDLGF